MKLLDADKLNFARKLEPDVVLYHQDSVDFTRRKIDKGFIKSILTLFINSIEGVERIEDNRRDNHATR